MSTVARYVVALSLTGPVSSVSAGGAARDETKSLAVSRHYELRGDVAPAFAAEMAALLDAAYEHLRELLGKAPPTDQRLVVNLFRTARVRDRALHGRLSAGGVFAYADRQCYLSCQPTEYYTRHLLIHEATHQFVCEAFGRRVDPFPAWLSEGLAEYVGHHNWDGRTLRIGQVNLITVDGNDRLARCRELLDQRKLSLATILRARASDRAPPWGLVHVLLTKPEWRVLLDRYIERCAAAPDGRSPTATQSAAWFREAFGRHEAAIAGGLEQFVQNTQRDWRLVWIDWQQRGDRIEGWANGRYALLAGNRLTHSRDRRVATSMTADDWAKTTAGIVISYQSARSFRIIELVEGKFLRHLRRQSGLWRELQVKRLPKLITGPGAVELIVECRADAIRATLDGTNWWNVGIRSQVEEGGVGLAVYRGRASFAPPEVTSVPASQPQAPPDPVMTEEADP